MSSFYGSINHEAALRQRAFLVFDFLEIHRSQKNNRKFFNLQRSPFPTVNRPMLASTCQNGTRGIKLAAPEVLASIDTSTKMERILLGSHKLREGYGSSLDAKVNLVYDKTIGVFS